MSGVVCDDACVNAFNEMKLKHTKRFIVFMIEDKKTIKIESEGDKAATYDDFVTALKASGGPRYAIVDVAYQTDDGRPQEKLAFIFFSPDSCGVKDKMLYASSKDAIKKKLVGFAKEIQANDDEEVSFAEVCKIMKA